MNRFDNIDEARESEELRSRVRGISWSSVRELRVKKFECFVCAFYRRVRVGVVKEGLDVSG